MSFKLEQWLPILRRLHGQIRDAVVAHCEKAGRAALSEVVREAPDDTIYAIDLVSEDIIKDFFTKELTSRNPILLIAEGMSNGQTIFPRDASAEEAQWRLIIDPIDGTRGLMYQKRSAWILTGVAPNKGQDTDLSDIQLAIQTEIPLVKQHLSDMVWAVAGRGVQAERYNRISGKSQNLFLQPSTAKNIEHGFATVSRFFPGARDVLAAIDDEIAQAALGHPQPGKALCYEDQYISTGGQLYELMSGKDRFIADIRPLLEKVLKKRNQSPGLCCHPYDICTELIARELNVIITDAFGKPLSSPLDLHTNLSWVGYANHEIKKRLEPFVQHALRKYELM